MTHYGDQVFFPQAWVQQRRLDDARLVVQQQAWQKGRRGETGKGDPVAEAEVPEHLAQEGLGPQADSGRDRSATMACGVGLSTGPDRKRVSSGPPDPHVCGKSNSIGGDR